MRRSSCYRVDIIIKLLQCVYSFKACGFGFFIWHCKLCSGFITCDYARIHFLCCFIETRLLIILKLFAFTWAKHFYIFAHSLAQITFRYLKDKSVKTFGLVAMNAFCTVYEILFNYVHAAFNIRNVIGSWINEKRTREVFFTHVNAQKEKQIFMLCSYYIILVHSFLTRLKKCCFVSIHTCSMY